MYWQAEWLEGSPVVRRTFQPGFVFALIYNKQLYGDVLL
jgi:hypothetical protein